MLHVTIKLHTGCKKKKRDQFCWRSAFGEKR